MDKQKIHKALTELFNDSNTLQPDKPIVIFSDTHLGDGGKADDFRWNVGIFKDALNYYQTNKYQPILLGDTEELWQFEPTEIEKHHQEIYTELAEMNAYRIVGNHDSVWKAPKDPVMQRPCRYPQTTNTYDSLIYKHPSGVTFFLLHGHQGSDNSDTYSWFSKFVVKVYGKWIEPRIKLDPHKTLKTAQIVKEFEQIFYEWAYKQSKLAIICGHTHRAIFASKSHADELQTQMEKYQLMVREANKSGDNFLVKKLLDKMEKLRVHLATEKMRNRNINIQGHRDTPYPCYFNTGCGIYTDGITCIEIDDREIRLIKWDKKCNGRIVYKKHQLLTLYNQLY